MANTKKNTTKPSAKNKPKKEILNEVISDSQEIVEEVKPIAQTTDIIVDAKVKAIKTKVELPLNMEVDVINGFHGRLTYVGKQSGITVDWEGFGDVQSIELKEIKSAFASQKKFFKENWWLFDDPDVIEFLRAEEFYKNALNSENFDDIFKMKPEEIEQIISGMTKGQKRSLGYRAIELINSGELDSRKTIDVLQKFIGFEIIEE